MPKGNVLELRYTENLLLRGPSRASNVCAENSLGRYERYIDDDPLRTYVPLLLRPWVVGWAQKEAVHQGEKVTIGLLQRFYW